jgi:hypothetical protein
MAALIGVTMKPAAAGSGYTCKVPLDLLAEDGVPPAEGDQVSYSVDGTVQSVDAENATIKLTAINGQPVSDESASDEATEDQSQPPGGPSTADLGAKLRKGAASNPMPMF